MILRITLNNKFNVNDTITFSNYTNWGTGTFDETNVTETTVALRSVKGQVTTGSTTIFQTSNLYNALVADYGTQFTFTQPTSTSIDITSINSSPIFNYSSSTTAATFSTTGVTIEVNSFPAILRPAYNPIVYTFVAQPDTTKQGYRYLVDVYNSKTNEVIGNVKITPTINSSGYADIQKLLSNYLTVDLYSNKTSLSNASNSHISFRAEIGEEYVYAKNYTGTQKFTGSSTYSGYTQVNFPTTVLFSAGTFIELSTLQSGINGMHLVLSASSNTLVIDKLWPSTTSLSGTARFSDYRKIQTKGISIVSGTTAFNGTLDWAKYKVWTPSNYVIDYTGGSQTKLLLTSLPTASQIGTNSENRILTTETQDYWINFYIDNMTGTSLYCRTELFTSTDFSKQSTAYQIQTTGETSYSNVKQFKVGFNLFGVTLEAGDYMKFKLVDFGNTPFTQEYRLDLDTRCRREEYQILFMDSFGSIQSMAFQNKADRKQNIMRDTYSKTNFIPLPSQTNLEDGGMMIYNVEEEITYTLISNWLTTGQSNMYNELMSSARTWIRINNQYFNCVVQETDNQMMVQKDRKIFNKTISVKLSQNKNINI